MVEFLADIVRSTATDGKKSATAVQVHLEILNSVRRIACDPDFINDASTVGGGSGFSRKSSRSSMGSPHKENSSSSRSSPFANECFPKLMELVDNLLFSFNLAKGSISQAFDTLPLLIKQETNSYKCALDLLLALYHDKENQVNQGIIEQRILSLLSDG